MFSNIRGRNLRGGYSLWSVRSLTYRTAKHCTLDLSERYNIFNGRITTSFTTNMSSSLSISTWSLQNKLITSGLIILATSDMSKQTFSFTCYCFYWLTQYTASYICLKNSSKTLCRDLINFKYCVVFHNFCSKIGKYIHVYIRNMIGYHKSLFMFIVHPLALNFSWLQHLISCQILYSINLLMKYYQLLLALNLKKLLFVLKTPIIKDFEDG